MQSSSRIIDLLFFLFFLNFSFPLLYPFLVAVGKRHPKTKVASLGRCSDMHTFFATYFAKFNPRFRVQCSTSCPLRVPFPCSLNHRLKPEQPSTRGSLGSRQRGGQATGGGENQPSLRHTKSADFHLEISIRKCGYC